MKTKTNKTKTMIALFAVLTVTVVLSIGAAPALAGMPHLESSEVLKVMQTPAELDKVHQILDSLIPSAVEEDVAEALAPDHPVIPDGGDWEAWFPEDDTDDPGATEDSDDAADESVEETVDEDPEDATDEAVDEGVDEAADDACEEEATDDADDEGHSEGDDTDDGAGEEVDTDEAEDEVVEDEEPQADEPQDDGDEGVGLPFTGGNSTPWLIAGAAIILAGASLLFGRRSRRENR